MADEETVNTGGLFSLDERCLYVGVGAAQTRTRLARLDLRAGPIRSFMCTTLAGDRSPAALWTNTGVTARGNERSSRNSISRDAGPVCVCVCVCV